VIYAIVQMSSQIQPSDFSLAIAAAVEQFKPMCASFAAGIVTKRNFMDPRYMNRELMTNEITMILSQWFAREITTLVTRVLNTTKQEDRNAYLSDVVRTELQQPVARVLCPLHDRFRGQDDGLFGVTASETYKSLHWDLVESLIEMIGMYGDAVAESW
jgi:hypothetical protein